MAEGNIISRLRGHWFTPVNNSPLIVFRILFGAVMLMEFGGSLRSGWVKEVYIDAPMRFPFIGFEFLEHMSGTGMYAYFAVASVLSLMVAVGLLYRPASILLALMWSAVYFSQKAHYNNHYYLMMLIGWFMAIAPANKRASLDVKLGFVRPSNECYRWCLQLFIIQTTIVYVFASIAKMYPDWLQAMPVKLWFSRRVNHPYLGSLFANETFAYFVAYSGVLFDLLIVPALLWKRTRTMAVIAMLIFHQFNKITFGIGVFPYLAMSLNVFFFPGKTFDNTVGVESRDISFKESLLTKQKYLTMLFGVYIIWQVLTPLRHHFYKGDVVWTEEGHRMSWRMMLRSKKGEITFTVKDKHTDSTWTILPADYMLSHQERGVATRPDFIWQFATHLRKKYKEKGLDVRVFAKSMCSVNGRPKRLLVDPDVDIAATEWNHFRHNDWILTDYK